MNFDKNYKNHNLKSIKSSKCIFQCNKCDNIIKTENYPGSTIVYYVLNLNNGLFDQYYENYLTCDEYIVKNIIE